MATATTHKGATVPGVAQALAHLDSYNVVWSTPSQDASGSMPIGNGAVGLNAWVEPNGDLVFLISRTDSWSECNRLLKVGRVRVSVRPNPFVAGRFKQELLLRDGRIQVTEGRTKVTLLVDSGQDVAWVSVKSPTRVQVVAKLEDWRSERRVLQGDELSSSWTMRDAPSTIEVWESPDTVETGPTGVLWYHRNAYSVAPMTLERQGLESIAHLAPDPMLNNTFGGLMWGPTFKKTGDGALTSRLAQEHELAIATLRSQVPTAQEWVRSIQVLRSKAGTFTAAKARTADWWKAFWSRSWVFASGDTAFDVPVNNHPLRLGADSSGGSTYDGTIKAVRVFDGPLADERVHQVYGDIPVATPPGVQMVLAVWADGDRAAVRTLDTFDHLATSTLDDPSPYRMTSRSLDFSGKGLDVLKKVRWQHGFTITALVKPRKLGGRIVDNVTPGGSDGFLFDTYAGKLRLIVGPQTLVGPALKSEVWQELGASYDGRTGQMKLFVGGKLVAESPSDSTTKSLATRGYVLQRWMTACAGRGAFPIKFNGSIFTVDPKYAGGPDFNPDWRRWGDSYWWQNTRFPYEPMPMNGDTDLMRPLFRMFEAIEPICKARAKLYYGADGAYFPETVTNFGTYANGDYQWNREGHASSEILSPWWQYAWQQGLELVSLMIDAYDQTEDKTFLQHELFPMATDVLRYYDLRFKRDAKGKLVIAPTQAVETYWSGVENDMPSVAGLAYVTDRLLRLPGLSGQDRSFFKRMKDACPNIPTTVREGAKTLLPAAKFEDKRSNVENPELYAVWPFKLFGIGHGNEAVAQTAWKSRIAQDNHGWQYDGQCAALAGLTDEAKASLMEKARNSNPGFRFPAMWGPNYDWLPDQCHGGNLMLTMQNMLMQCVGDKIYVLPAWPKDWDVSFKLHAPRKTTVEVEYAGGKVRSVKVTPSSRRKDVVVQPTLSTSER